MKYMYSNYRKDRDSLGEIEVPENAYYGAFTSRAMNQYKINLLPPHHQLIKSFVLVKKAAALANKDLKVLDETVADAITKACDDILDGKYLEHFVIETMNSGAGTAFNMNCNEVIANIA